MENCRNYLLTCAENIVLEHRINQLENGSNTKPPDLQKIGKYYFGKITLSDQLTILDVHFSMQSLNEPLQEFTGKTYELLKNTTSYGLHFPLLSIPKDDVPYVVSCNSNVHDEAICFVIPMQNGQGYDMIFYGLKDHNSLIDLGKLTETNNAYFKTSSYLLNALLEVSQDGIFILNAKREIQAINTAGKHILQSYYKHIPETGELFDRYISRNQIQKYLKRTTEALNGTSSKDEVVVRTPEGKQEWYDYNYHPVINDANDVVYLLIKCTNKTRARIVERRYYETKLKADETERLKKAFLNSMSHEVRTPMNGIIGFADLLNRPQLPDEKKQKYAALIKDNSQHLMDAFVEILDLARMESGELMLNEVHFDLNKLFDDLYFYTKNHFRNIRHKNVSFTYHKGNGNNEMILKADKGKVKQIILNLLSNSFKNTINGYIHFGYCFDDTGALKIYTLDSGKGIGYRQKDDDTVYQEPGAWPSGASPHDMKSGMGHSVLKEYVQFLKGELNIYTQQGVGSFYTIHLDLPDAQLREFIKEPGESNPYKLVYCPRDHHAMIKPFLPLLPGSSEVLYYDIPAFPFQQDDDHKIILFQSGQKLSEIKKIIDALDAERYLFMYFTDEVQEEEKAICYEYGIHEYLSYHMDTAHFTSILQKYNC